MRTTVSLDPDIARAVESLRKEHGLSTSAAINKLARKGLQSDTGSLPPFKQTVSNMGRPLLPLEDVAGALELLEGAD